MTGKRKISHLSSRRGGESRKLQASQSRAPGKMMGQILLKAIFRHTKNKKVTGNRQQNMTNLTAFYSSIISSMDKGTAVDVAYLDFSMTFDAVHSIFIDRLVRHRLNKWIIRIAVVKSYYRINQKLIFSR